MNRMTIAGSRDEAIVVTGMGVVSAAGDSLADSAGRSRHHTDFVFDVHADDSVFR